MPEEADDLTDTIKEAAEAPKKIAVDGQTVENHDLASLIEADRYLKSRTAAASGLGVRYSKFVPPGSV